MKSFRAEFGSPWLLLLGLCLSFTVCLWRLRCDEWRLDIGTAAARPYLLAGFFEDECADGVTFCWSTDGYAVISLPELTEVHHVRIRATAMTRLDPVVVGVDLDGRLLGTFPVHAAWNTTTLDVPAGSPLGRRLTFRFSRAGVPAELDPTSSDRRRLSVAFDSVTFLP